MNVVLLLNCDAANEKAGLRQAHNVLRQLCDNGNKVTIFGEWKHFDAKPLTFRCKHLFGKTRHYYMATPTVQAGNCTGKTRRRIFIVSYKVRRRRSSISLWFDLVA